MPTKPRPPSAERILFGRRLRAERHAKGLTLEDVAESADMNWSYIAQVERGTRNVGIDNMAALASAVNVQLAFLLQDGDEHAKHGSEAH
ncbi:helix-turn-helix domain-containing protein [Deinococcus arenicola]|uniref:Helix-turn-helix transcriptional regulator n=1 Tax=Deinococcus arenicola TaxID=2994950 RepID=A0ABU4DP04_9DEIO|nr:helix-turn-helix transcriptional regulator [Deinococcus sp. ZS9-10]MDV6374163.1 helix-turn-helix transcriptional regulator [Deinococcus sp. ZS9-10]